MFTFIIPSQLDLWYMLSLSEAEAAEFYKNVVLGESEDY